MRGVIGILLIVAGLEGAYLVLSGKLPLQASQSKKPASGGTGGGGDIKGYLPRSTPRKTPHAGYQIPQWGGLAK